MGVRVDRRVLKRGALLLVLLLAFALRISGLTAQSLWRDEVDALRFSQEPLQTLVSNFSRVGWNGPLYYVILRGWVAFAGQSEFALRYLSLCLGVIGVALIYRLGQRWFQPVVGGLGALLLACSPYMVWYSQETKMYALLCVMALAVLLAYRRALAGGTWLTWMATLLLAWGTVAVHYLGGLILPLLIALTLVWWPQARARWRQALLTLAFISLPGLVALPWVLPLILRGGDLGYSAYSLGSMLQVMLHVFARGILPGGREGPMALALFAMLVGSMLWPNAGVWSWLLRALLGWFENWRSAAALRALRERFENWRSAPALRALRERFENWRNVLALWAWMGVPTLSLYAVSLRTPMFVDRYLIWIGPAVYLLIARGLDQIRRRSVLVFCLCLVAVLGFSGWSVWQQSDTPIKADLRSAAAYVQDHRQPGELVLFHISYIRYTFEYYYGDATPYADGVATNDKTQPSDVDAAMRQRTDGYDVVWLVLTEPEMWDRQGMTVGWLDTHATERARADFERVSVVKYDLGGLRGP